MNLNIKLNNNTISSPVATPIRTTTYTVTVIDSLSCSNSATVTINFDCDDLVIPNGITPDGDGVNDFFEILGLRYYENNSLQVFNRWGNLVYKSKPYNNDWNGKCLEKGVVSGDNLPDGTYYYILELGDGIEGRSGFIEIRR